MVCEVDDIKVYRGSDIPIGNGIVVKQPTINEIIDFGERKYFSAVRNITAVGADLKWELWKNEIDYTKISDYELFLTVIKGMCQSHKVLYDKIMASDEKDKFNESELIQLLENPMSLVLNIDLADFELMQSKLNGDLILYNKKDDIVIDKLIYLKIVETIRKIHMFKRNNQMPANERTKMDLIEDDRDECEMRKNQEYKSVLIPIISTIVAKNTGMFQSVWDMKINMVLDYVRRTRKIQDAEFLMQGAYAGFASLKGIDKSRLDCFGNY